MKRHFFVWIFCGILSTLPLSSGIPVFQCTDKDSLLREIASIVTRPSDCVMECTGLTYNKKLSLQDPQTIRLKDSTEGDDGEHCWSADLQCTPGETLHRAFVVLPVNVSAVDHQPLDLSVTSSTAPLGQHRGPSALAQDCGLRYDVTDQLNPRHGGPTFCVQVVTHQEPPGDGVLRCPPYLATVWRRSPTQSKQGG